MVAQLTPPRGRPAKGSAIRLGIRMERDGERDAWRDARRAARVIHYATVAERPDIVLHSAGQIVSLADRRLRQLGEPDGTS